MKLATDVSSDKLRGGFYTPEPLVQVCLERVTHLCGTQRELTVLEPSVGDGAFLQGLRDHRLAEQIAQFRGVELIESELRKCQQLALSVPFDTMLYHSNILQWAIDTWDQVDVVIGNPPFVRYQFLPRSDLQYIEQLGKRLHLTFRGVSNLWVPVLVGSLNRLREGGVMALVVPAEIFTGLSAGDARRWLLQNFESLRVDMFAPKSFPGVLQEVVVISGRRCTSDALFCKNHSHVEFVQHSSLGESYQWSQNIPHQTRSWTQYLLTPNQLDAYNEAKQLQSVEVLGKVVKLEVSIVTGANDFFSVTNDEIAQYSLQSWTEPLLPRIRYAEGLVYTREDHQVTVAQGTKAWLLNFSATQPNPLQFPDARRYIKLGEDKELNMRYKTSIRSPWYRVPSIWAGKLMLSKRSHTFPRLVLNDAAVLTTDTIYRGQTLPLYQGRETDIVASFHNSLTLLSAELEGRSFGGGVLELVPSEVARLSLPLALGMREKLEDLDRLARKCLTHASSHTDLIEATDNFVALAVPGLNKTLLARLSEARAMLASRRLSRN